MSRFHHTSLCNIEETDGIVSFHERENEDPFQSKFNSMMQPHLRVLRRSPRASNFSLVLNSMNGTAVEESKEMTERVDHKAVVVNNKRKRRIAKMFERMRSGKSKILPSKNAVSEETATTPLSNKIDFVPRNNMNDKVEKMERGIGRVVSFGSVCVQYYPMTLGDNPSVSKGPPIQLDWCHSEESRTDLDEYELGRRRSFYREKLPTRMSVNKRMDIGMHAGYTWFQVVMLSREVKQFKKEKVERRRKEIKQERKRAERKEPFVEIWI